MMYENHAAILESGRIIEGFKNATDVNTFAEKHCPDDPIVRLMVRTEGHGKEHKPEDMKSCRPSKEMQVPTHHPQAEVVTPWGDTIEVDEGMAELLRTVWSLGLKTQFSCQDLNRAGRAHIIFFSLADACTFIRHVGNGNDHIMWNEVSLHPMKRMGEEDFRASVEFPSTSIDTINYLLSGALTGV